MITQSLEINSNLLSPILFLLLSIIIFHCSAIGIINSTASSGSIGLANSYLLEIKKFSLTEKLIYTIPIWVSILMLLKITSLFFKNEAKKNFIYFTSYLIGTFLILFLITRFILLFIYLLGWEILPDKPFYYSIQKTKKLIDPILVVNFKLDVVFSILIFLTCFYKLKVYFKKRKKRINIILLYPLLCSLLLFCFFKITRIGINSIEKYFHQNKIQIVTQLGNDKEFLFHLITNNDTLHKLETTFYITNKSSDNIILDPKEKFLLNFSSVSNNDKSSLADSLTFLQYNFKSSEINDSSILIIKSGETKILKFESTIDSLKLRWLIPHFNDFDRIEQEFYIKINLKSTDKFYRQPYYRKKFIITR